MRGSFGQLVGLARKATGVLLGPQFHRCGSTAPPFAYSSSSYLPSLWGPLSTMPTASLINSRCVVCPQVPLQFWLRGNAPYSIFDEGRGIRASLFTDYGTTHESLPCGLRPEKAAQGKIGFHVCFLRFTGRKLECIYRYALQTVNYVPCVVFRSK